MAKKLTPEEKKAYSIVQSIRGKAGAEKAGTKGMSKRGKKGSDVRWLKKKKDK